jgi:transcriptional regulator with XRE-family HTH domain
MNVRQCRMARAALDWSQHDLAKASGVSWRTISRFEAGESVLPARVQKLRHALEEQGVLFVDNGPLLGAVVPPRTGA